MATPSVDAVISQDHLAPTSASAVAEPAPAGAKGFWITCLTQSCRVSVDGTVATATNGLAIPAGVMEPVYLPFAQSLSIIGLNVSASDVTVVWVK